MYGSWLALCLGMLLLFMAVVAWLDFKEILAGRDSKDSMAEYLIIGKVIHQSNSGRDVRNNLFDTAEINIIKHTKGVQGVGLLTSNRFPVTATIGGGMGLTTDLFLESTDDEFLDNLPADWNWQPGNNNVPVIMSNEFLNLYNYGFALSQGLPQLSQKTIRAIPFIITIDGREQFRAQIVGFTDRISSLLVPQPFMDNMNRLYGAQITPDPSRLILKVKDPSDEKFISFLNQKNYTVNQDQLRWSRIRSVVQAIVASVGIVAVIVVGMSVLAFLLFVEITVQRAAAHIKLMMQLGYAPKALSRVLIRFFFPWISSAVVIAILVAAGLHYGLLQWLAGMDLNVPFFTALPVLYTGTFIIFAMGLLLWRTANGMLRKI